MKSIFITFPDTDKAEEIFNLIRRDRDFNFKKLDKEGLIEMFAFISVIYNPLDRGFDLVKRAGNTENFGVIKHNGINSKDVKLYLVEWGHIIAEIEGFNRGDWLSAIEDFINNFSLTGDGL